MNKKDQQNIYHENVNVSLMVENEAPSESGITTNVIVIPKIQPIKQKFYLPFSTCLFLSIAIALLIAVSIYWYQIKYQHKNIYYQIMTSANQKKLTLKMYYKNEQ